MNYFLNPGDHYPVDKYVTLTVACRLCSGGGCNRCGHTAAATERVPLHKLPELIAQSEAFRKAAQEAQEEAQRKADAEAEARRLYDVQAAIPPAPAPVNPPLSFLTKTAAPAPDPPAPAPAPKKRGPFGRRDK